MAAVWVALGFLLGSVPSGVLLARLAGIDPRRAGSGNIGATNVARLAGLRFGIATFFADAAKGAAAVAVARAAGHSEAVAASAGLAAVLGHVFPPTLGFRGGKGVATAAGALLLLAPAPTVVAVGAFAATLATGRRVSLASLAGAAAASLGTILIEGLTVTSGVAAAMGLIVVVRHRDNLRRLRDGTEPRI